MNTFFDDVQFFFLSLFSATTEGSGQNKNAEKKGLWRLKVVMASNLLAMAST